MNGHPRDQAKVSVHCRWPLIRGTDGHVELCRDIDNVAVHSRWPLTTGVAQGRYYCTPFAHTNQTVYDNYTPGTVYTCMIFQSGTINSLYMCTYVQQAMY